MKKILLTRSIDENLVLASTLIPLGYHPVLCSMISYKDLYFDFSNFKKDSDIIITSKYAAKIIAENYPVATNCYVVGEESASILRSNHNIKNIHVFKDSEELKGITELPRNDIKSLLYFSGDIITTTFDNAERHIIYNIDYTPELSEEVINEIKSGIDYIMLYSKNCANNLIELLLKHNLLQNIKNSVVIAMSKNLASQFQGHVKTILYPDIPESNGMLKILADYDKKHAHKKN